ncbi:hypothetical protein Pcinc_034352 [Petrolisthes cinctipes]|uniref:Uncharacterized protein n=1 Tax=Petrolisthes cinctipes TaxID=88211 RepID=A0AAE1EQF4_PETCI|nr:hypothetical protein Pcinc_034352 [Petrolisthes cinctipes]
MRKSQLPLLKKAREEGKIAFFKHTKLIIKERTRHVSSSGGGEVNRGQRSAVGGVAVDGTSAGVDGGVTGPSGAGAGGPAASPAGAGGPAASPASAGGPAGPAASAGVEAAARTSAGTGKGYAVAVSGGRPEGGPFVDPTLGEASLQRSQRSQRSQRKK